MLRCFGLFSVISALTELTFEMPPLRLSITNCFDMFSEFAALHKIKKRGESRAFHHYVYL
jgi:hypothetical protein